MITTIIQNTLNNIINWFKTNFNVIAVIIISIFTAIIFLQNNQLSNKNNEIDRLNNNVQFYQGQADEANGNYGILKLTVNELNNSNDSIIKELVNVKNELEIKDKQLQQAQSQKQQIKLDTTIVVKSNDFYQEIKPNNLTSIIIAKKDSFLTTKIDIQNTQSGFLKVSRVYKNTYKNFFSRLFHFDFKKKNQYEFTIHNSNDLIKVTDTRLIEITE